MNIKMMLAALAFLASAASFRVLASDTGGFSTATGSPDAATTVTTLGELQAAVAAFKHHIVISGHLYGGPRLTTILFATKDWDNTTIEGAAGANGVLENIQLKFSGELLPAGTTLQNVVIRNIVFKGNIADLQSLPVQSYQSSDNAGVNYEGVSFRDTVNVWIDHCTFFDMSDDLMSISRGSDNVTVSYNHFYFTPDWMAMTPDPLWNWVGIYQDLANERLAMIIGANPSDSYIYGTNALHVTLHHNWIGPLIKGRPLLRGFVHAYDNYFDNTSTPTGMTAAGVWETQYTALQVGSGGVVYSESNYFLKTNQSNSIGLNSAGDSYQFFERNNVYDTTTGLSATGTAFGTSPVSYSYSPDPVANVPTLVQGMAGAR